MAVLGIPILEDLYPSTMDMWPLEAKEFNRNWTFYENLKAAGVIDPTKVVRTALQDAASVSGLLITTEAAVSELPEDKPAMPMGGGGMGGMGGMDF